MILVNSHPLRVSALLIALLLLISDVGRGISSALCAAEQKAAANQSRLIYRHVCYF